MPRRPDQLQYDVTTEGNYPKDADMITGPVSRVRDLKYGRNPGSTAAMYVHDGAAGPCITRAEIVRAQKDPGYINIEDGSRAIRLARSVYGVFPDNVSAAVIKHEIPCGAGRGDSPYEAFNRAWDGDPLSAFGGVVAISGMVDEETAEAIASKKLVEWVIAPGYTPEAMDALGKTRIRLMRCDPFDTELKIPGLEVRDIEGGYLVGQRYESNIVSPDMVEVKIGEPTDDDIDAALLNWIVCGQTKSNSVVVGDANRAHGIGSGQTSRVDAAHMALYKAAGRDFGKLLGDEKWATGLVAASDAFWPFTDGPELLAKAGVRGCIYPTGSNRDEEVIEAFEENGMFVLIPRPDPDDPTRIERAFY